MDQQLQGVYTVTYIVITAIGKNDKENKNI